jgi:argininosuccinate lyase
MTNKKNIPDKSTAKSWESRLEGGPDELAQLFVESLSYDRRLYKYDILGSVAHAQMLCKKGFITPDELSEIEGGLAEIQSEIESGSFEFDVVYEDIHMAIEAALVSKTGDAGRKLHTGRSRNDQISTDMRLWMREEVENIQELIRKLQRAFLDLAGRYASDIMPAYTHLQRAQPVSIAAYLLSYIEQLERDLSRLSDCKKRLNVLPLGSGAVAGSTLALDRESICHKLGFDSISGNSIDAVSDRDFCAEFIFDCSMIMTHLSRLAEDFILFMSTEYSFIRIADKYCTSSSMMPQKRNPDMLELIRGKVGSVHGALVAMLTILKAQPSSYNRDLQEDKLHIFKAADVVTACLRITEGIVSNTEFSSDRILKGIDEGFLDATALAEYLVSKGVPFRSAHGIVGTIVADCEKSGKKLSDLSLGQYRRHCEKITGDIFNVLGAANVAAAYKTVGSGGISQSIESIEYWRTRL